MGGDRLGGRTVAGKPGERRRQLVDRREEVDRARPRRADVQVQLIDGLKVGDLEKQRPAVGQDVGRADRQRVVAGLTRMPRRELGRAVARRCSGSSRPGRNDGSACSATSRSSGREKVSSTPFSWAWKAIGSWTGPPV